MGGPDAGDPGMPGPDTGGAVIGSGRTGRVIRGGLGGAGAVVAFPVLVSR
jgi:hypothetical protein